MNRRRYVSVAGAKSTVIIAKAGAYCKNGPAFLREGAAAPQSRPLP
ncbi:hypothetical protein KNP414_02706 [Paenibacillus mucilaginosus KNP414]|uniref:Uncharacterized protein n=1 Tax=Paenibacillus mucilaginosus (strain KNP414) TaxID=1036673 RepID=F8F8C0_PAEMK|nr:hypothetical protein KNP414_02706 [Paenibacillus mucilaginosus KNP414]